jgi:hypothetical protein
MPFLVRPCCCFPAKTLRHTRGHGISSAAALKHRTDSSWKKAKAQSRPRAKSDCEQLALQSGPLSWRSRLYFATSPPKSYSGPKSTFAAPAMAAMVADAVCECHSWNTRCAERQGWCHGIYNDT